MACHFTHTAQPPAIPWRLAILEQGPSWEGSDAAPSVAIVIPVFRQPALLIEALHSALSQRCPFGLAVIVVNDGCPFSETHAIGTAFALADPRVTYLHKANGGLSSARNSGIDYALAAWPGLRAIYFLDADNRLTGSAIASAASVMTRKGADWVYPHIDKFGMEWSGNYAAPYSRLAHVTFDNLCEAGSLVARHVFDAGLRFDETMKDGFEDWDFWLQAIAQGFTGELDPGLGLEYRQRAESMVASSNRRRARIIGELRVKHRALFAPARLLAWEHAEAPRFAIFEAEKNVVRGLTDPAQPQHLWRWEEWLQAFHAEACEPETFGTPPFLICLSGEVIEELRRLRLWPGVLWQIERLATRYALVVLHAVPDPVRIAFSVVLPGEFEPEGPPTGHALRQTSLRDQLSNPPNTAPNGLDRFKRDVVHLIIKAPFTGPLPGDPGLRRLLDANSGLRTKRQARRWSWRSTAYMPQLRRYHKHLGNSLGGSPIFVRSPTAPGRPQIGFALPIAAFGGVERVAVALAGILRASGYDTHLILLGAPEAALADQLIKNFDSIAILADPSIPLDGGKQRFFGHNFAVAADLERITPPLIGLCAGLDAIILSHTVTFSAMLGQLRELGIRTIAHLHVLDRTPLGREVGHPAIALAFEHAYDLMIACSETLSAWLHGMGVPAEKLLVLPNAPACELPPDTVAAHLASRAASRTGALRLLYLGRLDNQKGIERVWGAAKRIRALGLDIEWRVIGGGVIQSEQEAGWRAHFAGLGIKVEPPIYQDDALAEAFATSDLLLLPSRWEGAPLTILEAQRLGCVPIATRVGAVHELIEHEGDGILITDGSDALVTRELVAAIARLSEDRALLACLSAGAARRGRGRSWLSHAAPLLEKLDGWFQSKDARTNHGPCPQDR